MARIDSHQHFWKVERGDYHWMSPPVAILCRDYMPADLAPHLARHGIAKTVLVQAAQTTAETDFLLELASAHDFIAGVVGWLDLDSAEFGTRFESYCRNPRFIGLRPMLQDLPQDDWILRPRVLESLQLLAERGFPFDFLTYTRHLPYVLKVLEKVPDLRTVIDHISKPEIAARKLEPWKSLMSEVAAYPGVYCKLAGLITEADHGNWVPEDLRPYVEHVIAEFGLTRVMYGSDWPVCLLAGSYDDVVAAVRTALSTYLEPRTEAAVFGDNAERFYRIPAAASIAGR